MMPKNTSTKDYLLAGASFLGCALELLAAYKGPGFNGTVPAQWFINWVVIFNGLYGLGFITVPETLMKMNFEGSFDKMHLFMGRMIGGLMLTLCYIIYFELGTSAFKFAAISGAVVGLLGPTTAALYLSPKQTPDGHMPAHFLFLIGGILAVLAM